MPLAPTHLRMLSIPSLQGNVRQVTDADGNVEQDNHYYPYGMLMAESSDILAGALSNSNKDANPYLYGAKEYLTTAGANLLDFTARTYDPSTLLFQTQDPMSGDYTSFNAYLYCGANPVNRIDPDGKEWKYTHNDDDEEEDPKFVWVDPKDAYDSNGNLLPDHYVQAISFSAEGKKGKFDETSKWNIGTSTATVYKADGSTEDFDACTYPSDTKNYVTIPAGRYEAKVGLHKKSYTALRMRDVGTTNNKIKLNFENPYNKKFEAVGINIHHAGVDNLTKFTRKGKPISMGCMTIDYYRWDDFIGLFNTPDLKDLIIGIIILR